MGDELCNGHHGNRLSGWSSSCGLPQECHRAWACWDRLLKNWYIKRQWRNVTRLEVTCLRPPGSNLPVCLRSCVHVRETCAYFNWHVFKLNKWREKDNCVTLYTGEHHTIMGEAVTFFFLLLLFYTGKMRIFHILKISQLIKKKVLINYLFQCFTKVSHQVRDKNVWLLPPDIQRAFNKAIPTLISNIKDNTRENKPFFCFCLFVCSRMWNLPHTGRVKGIGSTAEGLPTTLGGEWKGQGPGWICLFVEEVNGRGNKGKSEASVLHLLAL